MAARGTPTEASWPLAKLRLLPDFSKISFKPTEAPAMAALVPRAGPDALSLLEALLALDPARRPSATEALRHRFFTAAGFGAVASDAEVAAVVAEALGAAAATAKRDATASLVKRFSSPRRRPADSFVAGDSFLFGASEEEEEEEEEMEEGAGDVGKRGREQERSTSSLTG